MSVGDAFRPGELTGFNVDYTRGNGQRVNRTMEGRLTREIAANDFTNLQDAIDAALAHDGAETIVRTDDGHFHLHHSADAPANSVSFDGMERFSSAERHTASERISEQYRDTRTRFEQNPTPENAAQYRQMATLLRAHGHDREAATIEPAIHAFEPLSGSQVVNGRYADPNAMLAQLSQRDSLVTASHDDERCGAASVVASVVLQGPAAVRALADAYRDQLGGRPIDENHLRPADLQRLQAAIFQDQQGIRMADENAPEEVQNRPGLIPTEVNTLMHGHYHQNAALDRQVSAAQVGTADDFRWDRLPNNESVSVLLSASHGNRPDHFVTVYRDNDGALHAYDSDPAVTTGPHPNRIDFANEGALRSWLSAHSADVTDRQGTVHHHSLQVIGPRAAALR